MYPKTITVDNGPEFIPPSLEPEDQSSRFLYGTHGFRCARDAAPAR